MPSVVGATVVVTLLSEELLVGGGIRKVFAQSCGSKKGLSKVLAAEIDVSTSQVGARLEVQNAKAEKMYT